MGLNAAAEFTHAEKMLTRGPIQADGAAIGAAQTLTFDVICPGDSTLKVEVDMTGAASGDLTVAVAPYERDGLTLLGVNLPAAAAVGPTFAGGRVSYYGVFDVSAVDRVRISLTNNNVGAQVMTRSGWRLS